MDVLVKVLFILKVFLLCVIGLLDEFNELDVYENWIVVLIRLGEIKLFLNVVWLWFLFDSECWYWFMNEKFVVFL